MPPVMSVQQVCKDLTNEYLRKFYHDFDTKYAGFLTSFRHDFLKICRSIRGKCDFPIAVLDVTMLRTNIVRHYYKAEVIAYGDDHFFDEKNCIAGEIDISPIFLAYEELYHIILKENRKYPMAVSVYEVDAYMLSVCTDFYKTITYMMRKNIYEWTETEEFKEVPFAADYEINCGEFAAYTETVFIRHHSKILKKERERLISGEGCNFADFTQLDLTDTEYENLDLRYSDFSKSRLDGCSFRECRLDFSYLRDVSAPGADFSDCILNGADFTGAKLEGAFFDAAANDAYYEEDTPPFVLEYRTSFCNADLRGTIFTNCDLAAMDFTGADLQGTQFDKSSLSTAFLSRQQQEEIYLISDESETSR